MEQGCGSFLGRSPAQRELCDFVVEYHKVLLQLMRPGVTDVQIQQEAAEDMARVVENTRTNKLLLIAHADRAGAIRITSARKATRNEHRFYQEAE